MATNKEIFSELWKLKADLSEGFEHRFVETNYERFQEDENAWMSDKQEACTQKLIRKYLKGLSNDAKVTHKLPTNKKKDSKKKGKASNTLEEAKLSTQESIHKRRNEIEDMGTESLMAEIDALMFELRRRIKK